MPFQSKLKDQDEVIIREKKLIPYFWQEMMFLLVYQIDKKHVGLFSYLMFGNLFISFFVESFLIRSM